MAVSVDRVYQKVLALANKEQRGYITPQEFNLFADQAQMAIFEQYFYDLEQRQRGTGNSFDYADIVSNIEEKISMFDVHDELHSSDETGQVSLSNLGGTMWRLGSVKVLYSGANSTFVGFAGINKYREAEQVQQKEINKYLDSYLTNRFGGPYYTRSSNVTGIPIIRIFPSPVDEVLISYIRKPNQPSWTYVIVDGASAVFNSGGGFVDFELHDSEENELVIKILQLAGVTIKDPGLIQVAAQEEMKNVQQEKQ
jgi:hypothetical protein